MKGGRFMSDWCLLCGRVNKVVETHVEIRHQELVRIVALECGHQFEALP